MKNIAVIGAGFGDEGKGKVVDWLCSKYLGSNPIVYRCTGGQQAGHTVHNAKGFEHVFASFGSGSSRGVPTYISKYCTLDPIALINEYEALKNKGVIPKLFVSSKTPITTPYEVFVDQTSQNENQTTGKGVGRTWEREEDGHSLLYEDLFFPEVLKIKLGLLYEYYDRIDVKVDLFLENVRLLKEISLQSEGCPLGDPIIYENSQGLLLDQNNGFFPYVTRSNTGIDNLSYCPDEIFIVTRAFQTRHGKGPMTNESIPFIVAENPFETNKMNRFQGSLRKTILDLDLIKYALMKEQLKTSKNWFSDPELKLVINHLDLVKDNWQFTVNGEIQKFINEVDFVTVIGEYLEIEDIYTSDSPLSESIKKFS